MATRSPFDAPEAVDAEFGILWKKFANASPALLRRTYWNNYNTITIPLQTPRHFFESAIAAARLAPDVPSLERELQHIRDDAVLEFERALAKLKDEPLSHLPIYERCNISESCRCASLASLTDWIFEKSELRKDSPTFEESTGKDQPCSDDVDSEQPDSWWNSCFYEDNNDVEWINLGKEGFERIVDLPDLQLKSVKHQIAEQVTTKPVSSSSCQAKQTSRQQTPPTTRQPEISPDEHSGKDESAQSPVHAHIQAATKDPPTIESSKDSKSSNSEDSESRTNCDDGGDTVPNTPETATQPPEDSPFESPSSGRTSNHKAKVKPANNDKSSPQTSKAKPPATEAIDASAKPSTKRSREEEEDDGLNVDDATPKKKRKDENSS